MVDSSCLFASATSLRSKPYVVGYSGCIPGMSFRYGQTFGRAAEDCMALFARQQASRQAREDTEARRAKSLPRMRSTKARPYDVSGDAPYAPAKGYGRRNTLFVPIPGYTGYIPQMRCTDVGIGRTFGAAARKGYSRVMSAREKRHAHLQSNSNIL